MLFRISIATIAVTGGLMAPVAAPIAGMVISTWAVSCTAIVVGLAL